MPESKPVYQDKEKQEKHEVWFGGCRGGKTYLISLERIIDQAKYATAEACVMCDNHCPKDRQPRKDGCQKCHVGKLIKMIKEGEK